MSAIGRNEPCHCGSGKKYKRCCAGKARKVPMGSRIALSVVGIMLLTGAIVMIMSLDEFGRESTGPRKVWSEAHQHWH